jgi:hypothetical protein
MNGLSADRKKASPHHGGSDRAYRDLLGPSVPPSAVTIGALCPVSRAQPPASLSTPPNPASRFDIDPARPDFDPCIQPEEIRNDEQQIQSGRR